MKANGYCATQDITRENHTYSAIIQIDAKMMMMIIILIFIIFGKRLVVGCIFCIFMMIRDEFQEEILFPSNLEINS